MMRFRVTDRVDFKEWQDIADQCDYATFFHTPLWFRVFSETYPKLKIATRQFVFEDGKVAIFPLIEKRRMRGLVKAYTSGPARSYGGWISAEPLRSDHVAAMTRWVMERLDNIAWRINPLEENAPLIDAYKTKEDSTEILYLSHFPDEETLKQNYKHSVRKQINKAIRANLSVRIAQTWGEWERYNELYRMSVSTWGDEASNNYPVEFFRNLYNLRNPKVRLWLVICEGDIVGGNLNFYQSRHCVEWHAVFDKAFLKFGSRNFLVHTIIMDALSNGYYFYDFNPSGGHEGARTFKQTFGTTKTSAGVIHRRHIPYGVVMLHKARRIFGL